MLRTQAFGELPQLRQPTLNAVLVERRLPSDVLAGFRLWARAPAFVFKCTADAAALDPVAMVARVPAPAVWPQRDNGGDLQRAREQLATDIGEIVRWMPSLTSSRRIEIAVVVTDHDECTKFHADFIHLRAVVTYAGPGTAYLPDEALDRTKLCCPESAPEANAMICTEPGLVVRAAVGDVMWLKGARASPVPAVHRSPPLERRGLRRLVLKVNEAAEIQSAG